MYYFSFRKKWETKYFRNPLIKLPKSVDSRVWKESYEFFDEMSEKDKIDSLTPWRNKNRLIELIKTGQ